jgi:type IV pilus biogenesis protein CpaD/CtpE
MGPNAVVIVRSEYLLGLNNCPTYNPATIANPNEAVMPGFGCADAYNMGQMLARPRDAAVGRPSGPADATVNAAAIARYRDGKVRALDTSGISGGTAGGGGIGGAATGATN